jgi:shikimate kinase
MKTVLIGHRGAGKTQLLKRHQSYFPVAQHYDLDIEIENTIQMPLSDYFIKVGEDDFRKTEQEVFKRLISENISFVISLGAGFDVLQLPKDVDVIFVSRVTDQDGRVFLNRPRLEKNMTALAEYRKRYSLRQPSFLKMATEIYDIPEGLEHEDRIERSVLGHSFQIEDAYYTLLEQEIKSIEVLMASYKKIELRTDLVTPTLIVEILKSYPQHDWLVSIRSAEQIDLKNAKHVDCDFQYDDGASSILSVHVDNIAEALDLLKDRSGRHLKLCPLVETFADLQLGHRWQAEDRQNRSFLPRSSHNGKWLWYRQLCKYSQKLNFVRNFTRMGDQPSVYEWLTLPVQRPLAWAAVLGKPVYSSRSPLEHQTYFSERKSFFTKIEITQEELKENFTFLSELGLGFAAVTSPLKEVADQIAQVKTHLKAANTLYIENKKAIATNTDIDGFKQLIKKIQPQDRVAIWGGGGTLDMMKSILPQADLYSSQSGQLRGEVGFKEAAYDYLIWGAPRSSTTLFPGDHLQIKEVIDLNYVEHSMGLEFAANRKISYTSGLGMFKVQALKQQQFWSHHECK